MEYESWCLTGDNLLRRDPPVWHIPVVGDLVCRCPALVEMDAGAAEEALASLGDTVTVWDSTVLLGPMVEGPGLVKLKPVMEVSLMDSEAVGGTRLVKVRRPGVKTVMLVVKGASEPEVGPEPDVTTILLLRILASCLRGVLLLVVEAKGQEREEG